MLVKYDLCESIREKVKKKKKKSEIGFGRGSQFQFGLASNRSSHPAYLFSFSLSFAYSISIIIYPNPPTILPFSSPDLCLRRANGIVHTEESLGLPSSRLGLAPVANRLWSGFSVGNFGHFSALGLAILIDPLLVPCGPTATSSSPSHVFCPFWPWLSLMRVLSKLTVAPKPKSCFYFTCRGLCQ